MARAAAQSYVSGRQGRAAPLEPSDDTASGDLEEPEQPSQAAPGFLTLQTT